MTRHLTHFEYCTTVCKGKCCTMHHAIDGAVTCPNLRKNYTCSVYKERYAEGQPDVVIVGHYRSKVLKNLTGHPVMMPFACGRIEQLLAQGAIPSDVAAKCCYRDPSVLIIKENETHGPAL